MKRIAALCVMALALVGCREVRVKTYAQGTTTTAGSNAITIVRSERELADLGIKAPVRFRKEFGVVLLMGPHKDSGYRQVIESIRANENRVRIVAFEQQTIDSEPTREYRTFTLWIVPNSVYRVGSRVEVVTPSGEPVASTLLR